VLVYAVVSSQTEKAVGLFVRREQAERFLEDVQPELAKRLRLEPVDLDEPATSDARRRAAIGVPAVEVKVGKPTLKNIQMHDAAVVFIRGRESSGGWHEEWVGVTVAVELQPGPDQDWLVLWRDGEMNWPRHLEEPILEGRKLIFQAREDELEEAWAAVKARVEATNRACRAEFPAFAKRREPDSHGAEQRSYAHLRETLERRVQALE
jgi:hypothetical protein